MNGRERGWALFDLDQTLVSWDMQAVWGNWVLRRQGWRRILLWPFLGLLPLAKVLGSGTMKRLFLGCCWAMERRDLEEVAEAFAERYVPAICYPDILEMLEKEKAAGRKTVLVSASPEIYVGRMGARLGFDHAFGTVVDWGEEEVGWFPRLPKGNNKGANKLVRLKEELGLEGPLEDSVGYSDSAADLPMLEICERKVVVNPEGELLARAEAEGWEIVRPERPWKSRWGFGWGCLRMLLGLFPK